MTRKRPRLWVGGALIFAIGMIAGGGIGGTFGAFSGTTSNGTNSFTASTDWTPPVVTGPVIDRSGDCSPNNPGFIHQGGAYFVYSNVTDSGNPSSGVSSVTGDVHTVTTGQTAASMSTTGGPFTVAGTSYNYRTSSVTADSVLAAGSKTYSVTATDGNSNSTNASASVTVDNTAPTGSDEQTTSVGGGTQGKVEQGDTITLTYSSTIESCSILSGWDGTSTSVTVRITDQGAGANDTVTIFNSGNTSQLPLGTVTLGATNYVKGGVGVATVFTPSTMVQSGSAITITLGPLTTASGNVTTGSAGTMVWAPSASATDLAGNACSTANTTESGASDKDF
jgi:hypothetical protein